MMPFFNSEDDDAGFSLHLHNFLQKTIWPIHISLSMCTYLSVPEMVDWLLQMMLWWSIKSEN